MSSTGTDGEDEMARANRRDLATLRRLTDADRVLAEMAPDDRRLSTADYEAIVSLRLRFQAIGAQIVRTWD